MKCVNHIFFKVNTKQSKKKRQQKFAVDALHTLLLVFTFRKQEVG